MMRCVLKLYLCRNKKGIIMAKRILVISSSPRRGGNSDMMCDEFIRGARTAGNNVEKVSLREKTVNYCKGCDACSQYGRPCFQKDDAAGIIQQMLDADVIVFGTPVYFYSMSAQMKTLLDRCCGLYTEMKNKRFFFIASAAEEDPSIMDRIIDSFRGFLDCLENPEIAGSVFCGGVWHAGEIKGNPALQKAYEEGLRI